MKDKLKIVVYAICQNEAKFVKRWMDSMKEADEVVVLDTGSNDATVSLLRSYGAKVTTPKPCAVPCLCIIPITLRARFRRATGYIVHCLIGSLILKPKFFRRF